jgi:hypothetical protein
MKAFSGCFSQDGWRRVLGSGIVVLAAAVARTHAATYYVNATNPSPTYPYTSWATAAQTIKDAVGAALPGSTVIVAAAYYQTDWGVMPTGNIRSRVVVNKPLTLKSASGASNTYIVGASSPSGWYGCGASAIRCVSVVTSDVHVIGFTLSGGHTLTSGVSDVDQCGGGAWVATECARVVFQDCIFTGCVAYQEGGGAYRGTYSNGQFISCRAWNGGGAARATVTASRVVGCVAGSAGGGLCHGAASDCEFSQNASGGTGGAVYNGVLQRSSMLNNTSSYGGGVYFATCESCWLTGNRATMYGGGASYSKLRNCTLVDNRAGSAGGAGDVSSFTNCILWSNSAPAYASVRTNCTGRYNFVVLPAGMTWPDTIAGDPRFREDYRIRPVLKGSSPCINAGTNYTGAASDRDWMGRRRVIYGRVDLGACEYVSTLNDYDTDGCSDLTTYRQIGSDWRMWSLLSGSSTIMRWGPENVAAGLTPVPFTDRNDGHFTPYAYRETTGEWAPYPFTNVTQHGGPGFVPVWGDYDGDGYYEMAVYELNSGKWYIRMLSGGILAWGLQWGYQGAVPVPGDYNRDGAADLAVYDLATGRWYIRSLAGAEPVIAWNRQWGFNGAIPVPGDYNGDGFFDLCVYDKAAAKWYITGVTPNSSALVWGWQWGYAGARPVPGDFDGDGSYDLAVFDPAAAVWFVREITSPAPLYWNFYMRPGTAVGMVTW